MEIILLKLIQMEQTLKQALIFEFIIFRLTIKSTQNQEAKSFLDLLKSLTLKNWRTKIIILLLF